MSVYGMMFTDCSWSRQIRRHNLEFRRRRATTEGCIPCRRHTDADRHRIASGARGCRHLFISAARHMAHGITEREKA